MSERPLIAGYDDLLTIADICELLQVTPATLRRYMRGIAGKTSTILPLPYVKIGKTPFFSKAQFAWWLQRIQEQPDAAMVDVRRAMRGST